MKTGAGIAQSVWRLAAGWEAERSEFESRWERDIFLLHVILSGTRAHPVSYSVGTGVKRPGCEADHSPPTSTEAKNTWIYKFIPLTPSWHIA
jgi:hypothetical protein